MMRYYRNLFLLFVRALIFVCFNKNKYGKGKKKVYSSCTYWAVGGSPVRQQCAEGCRAFLWPARRAAWWPGQSGTWGAWRARRWCTRMARTATAALWTSLKMTRSDIGWHKSKQIEINVYSLPFEIRPYPLELISQNQHSFLVMKQCFSFPIN